MGSIRILWLGAPAVESDGDALHFETRKALALVAYISLSPAPIPRESLAALFWPEYDQAHAQANLRRALFAINRRLGPGLLESSRETLGMNPEFPVWQDTGEFRRLLAAVEAHRHPEVSACPACIQALEGAVALPRGEFLAGLNLRDCPDFDEWQNLQREGFRRELAAALEKLAQAYLSLGEWEPAIRTARRWAGLDPLDENAQRLLIHAYARAGQRRAALQQFETYAQALQAELGEHPGEETVALVRQIQAGEPDTGGERPGTGTRRPPPGPDPPPLVRTKLFIPQPGAGWVARPQLLGKLTQGAHRALTLISAPAGYGKTSLLAAWVNGMQEAGSAPPWAVCWLSLDPGDNDPTRFLAYLAAALENAHPGAGAETQALIGAAGPLDPSTPVSGLVNDLQALARPVLLVLDDYHLISNPAIHAGLAYLLEHAPKNLHVVIATRADPPFPLARLRGRNQLAEIRAHDLRFTSAETAELLNRGFGLALAPEQVAVFADRTEGWVAGLQLAAISLQGRADKSQFIATFSGSHRFIMDYLAEEALNRQPVDIQAFLLQTSILEQLSEPLCAAMLGDREIGDRDLEVGRASPIPSPQSPAFSYQSILEYLERANLFLLPLDDERTWYRYHHLFAELLRTRLRHASPELVPRLHTRAAAWLERHGWVEAAIEHWLAAREWRQAARLVMQHIPPYLETGKMATVLEWIEALPTEIILANPKLSELVAEVFSQGGRIDEIDPYLDRAEALVAALAPTPENQAEAAGPAPGVDLLPDEITVIRAMAGILRGLKAVCLGDPAGALAFTQKTLRAVPEMKPKERAVLHWVEGWANRSLGRLARAIELFTRAAEFEHESGATLRDIRTDLAITYRSLGKLPLAIAIFTDSLHPAAGRGAQDQGNRSRGEAHLSLLYLEQNRLDLAWTHARRAIADTQWWPSHNVLAMACASLAQICLARGDLDGGLAAAQEADRARQSRLMTPFVHSMVDVTLVQTWLARGEWDLLEQWSSSQSAAEGERLTAGGGLDESLEMRLVMLARVWLRQRASEAGREEDCFRLLARLEENARAAGRVNTLVEVLVLKESLRFSQGNTRRALAGLEECLSLAGPGGYMRIFLNTGEPARALLAAYLKGSNPAYRSYARRILQAFGGEPSGPNPREGSPEALTARELEVLRLIAEGYSNRQIAARLVLSAGTVKFHVHNLLGKLNAASRTGALARAKDLGLI